MWVKVDEGASWPARVIFSAWRNRGGEATGFGGFARKVEVGQDEPGDDLPQE